LTLQAWSGPGLPNRWSRESAKTFSVDPRSANLTFIGKPDPTASRFLARSPNQRSRISCVAHSVQCSRSSKRRRILRSCGQHWRRRAPRTAGVARVSPELLRRLCARPWRQQCRGRLSSPNDLASPRDGSGSEQVTVTALIATRRTGRTSRSPRT